MNFNFYTNTFVDNISSVMPNLNNVRNIDEIVKIDGLNAMENINKELADIISKLDQVVTQISNDKKIIKNNRQELGL